MDLHESESALDEREPREAHAVVARRLCDSASGTGDCRTNGRLTEAVLERNRTSEQEELDRQVEVQGHERREPGVGDAHVNERTEVVDGALGRRIQFSVGQFDRDLAQRAEMANQRSRLGRFDRPNLRVEKLVEVGEEALQAR